MILNQWLLFEGDICAECNHPKVAKLCAPPKGDRTLQIIISCDCDPTVFDQAWKHARDSDELIVVVEGTAMGFVESVAEIIATNGG